MHIYPIFVERRPPPKGYWQLVGEWIRAMEWPDATEKEFLIKQSKVQERAGEVPEAPGEVQPVEAEATRRKSEKAAEQ